MAILKVLFWGHPVSLGCFTPVLLNGGAVFNSLVTPNIPTRAAANFFSKTFFDASGKGVLVVFNATISMHVLLYVLDGKYLVIELEMVQITR